MDILGFNSTHDASAALVRDGRILCAVEEERFSRSKHHYGYPERAIRACLKAGGIDYPDLDHMAFYWDVGKGLVPFVWHVLRHFPRTLAYFDHQPAIFSSFRHLRQLVKKTYGFRGRFHFLDHHGNHIASSFWPSGFGSAAAMTVDGTGEWETTVLARVEKGGRLERLGSVDYPHSVGKLWEAVTQYLGFRPNSGEGKVMGLAPYGRPALVPKFREILRTTGEGRYRLDLRYFDFHYGLERKYSDRFVRKFGPPREPESPMEERFEDVAFALQTVTEEVLLDLASQLYRRTGEKHLVMAGGVALNSVANGRIQRETPFEEVFVQPSAGDAGAALGAALRVWHEVLGNGTKGRHVITDAYLGPDYTEADVVSALESRHVSSHRLKDVPKEAAKYLAEGRILGWWQGRSEYGPRALGHRSILADPREEKTRDLLNARVKHREAFRPFAPAVLAERADEYFDTNGAGAPFMLKVFPVRPEMRERIPAVTHVDGTARVQTVRREQEPRYYDLIRAFGERTGIPVILNTSFNVRGEPIVETPGDAIDCFLGTGLDLLVLGDHLVVKEDPDLHRPRT